MSSTKKAAKPNKTVKNGMVYGDALSAEEKKKIVLQKKRDRKAKKVPKSAQQTIKRDKEQVAKQEKPSIREQLKAAKAQTERKAPTKSKSRDMGLE